MRQVTSEERIRRVWDKEEAKAVLCRHAYLEAANRRAESLSQLWVAEPEHQATASYGKNWGYYVGMDAIRSYYVDRNPIGGVGTNICHPVATICIEEAEDGQTCQAMCTMPPTKPAWWMASSPPCGWRRSAAPTW